MLRIEPNQPVSLSSPLLVWVDDNPSNNTRFFKDAKKLGIENIELLLSSGEAKTWIDAHLGNLNTLRHS
jgi:hypothetical protein